MRNTIKEFISFSFVVMTFPFAILFKVCSLFLNRDSLFASYSQLFSLLPGKLGSYLRKGFYFQVMNDCNLNCYIGFGTLFSQQGTDIQKCVYIGPQCNIGSCNIGDNCLLGSGVHILSGKNQHNFKDLSIPIAQQGGTYEKISIGKDSWIGNGAIVMADIGDHCIVAAGSVVTKPISSFDIVAGNPAKVIGSRLEDSVSP